MMLHSWVRSPFGSWARVKCSSWVGSSPCRLPPTLRAALCLSPGSLPTNYELYYGFTRFAVELNELDPVLKDLLPPTDARFRPDQRSGLPQGFCSVLEDNMGVRLLGLFSPSLVCSSCIFSSPYSLRNTWVSCPGQNGICGNIVTETYWTVAGSFCIVTKCLSTQLVTSESCLALGFWPLDTHCRITWSVLWVTGIPGGDLTETQSHTLVPEAVELYSNYRIHHFFGSLYVIMMFTSTEFISPKFLCHLCSITQQVSVSHVYVEVFFFPS